MALKQNKQILDCSDFEQLLIKNKIDELNPEESQVLEKHLQNCKNGRKYQVTLIKIEKSTNMLEGLELVPDIAIRQNLIKKLSDGTILEKRLLWKSFELFRNIIEYRIPAYQAVIAFFFAMVIFFTAQNYLSVDWNENEQTGNVQQIQNSSVMQLNVIDNVQLINSQNIGQNVREDSILTQFIYNSM